MSQTVLAIVIAVIAVLAVIAAVIMIVRSQKRKKADTDRATASQLRAEATADTREVDEARLDASEAKIRAERRRLEAERAEADVVDADHKKAMEEARIEDQVRTADRIDPEVDHRAKGYTPAPVGGQDGVPKDADHTREVPAVGDAHPEGSTVNEDGTITYPDGSIRASDGTTVDPGR